MPEFPRVAGRALIVHKGKLLLVNATRFNDDKWCTPGGGVDCGENLKAGLVREVLEETGLNVEVQNLTAVSEYFNNDDGFHQIEIFFVVKVINGDLSDNWKDEGGVVEKSGFFSLEEIKDMKILPAFLKDGFWVNDNKDDVIYKGHEEGEDLKWKM